MSRDVLSDLSSIDIPNLPRFRWPDVLGYRGRPLRSPRPFLYRRSWTPDSPDRGRRLEPTQIDVLKLHSHGRTHMNLQGQPAVDQSLRVAILQFAHR